MLTLVLPGLVESQAGWERKDHTLGLLIAAGALVGASAQILSGALSDVTRTRFGRRRPYLAAGTLLGTAVLFVFPSLHGVAALFWGYIGLQALLNVAIGPYQAMIPDRIPTAYHGRASTYMGVWQLLGRICGPVAASILLSRTDGLRDLFVVFCIVFNVCMAANLILLRKPDPDSETPGGSGGIRGILRLPLKPYPSFVWLVVSRFGIMMGFYSVLPFLLYYLRGAMGITDEAEARDTLARFLALSTATGLIGVAPAGKLSDRLSKKTMMYAANAVCALAAFGFLISADLLQAYIAVGVFGFGFSAFTVVDWALGCSLIPEHARAKYLGFWGLSDTVPQIVAPAAAGFAASFINDRLGGGTGYRALMIIAMIYFALGTLALRNIVESKPVSKTAPL